MRNKFYHFLQGRYAKIDSLYKFLFTFYIILIFINIFFRSIFIEIFQLIIIIYMFYRFFSKNVNKRYYENKRFNDIKDKLLFKNISKDNIYKRCHHCHSLLKLPIPSKRGLKEVKCPKCKKINKFLILRKEKIDIIRKKDK